VVLDGSNIAHGGSGGSGLDGRRVVSAISLYREKGYDVIPVFKAETYHYMRTKGKPGFKQLRKLEDEGILLLFKKNDDHLAIVLALEHNAWLITHDTFKTFKKEEPKERRLHPEWFENGELDALTRGTFEEDDGWISSGHDWKVKDTEFYDPDMPKAPPSSEFSEFDEISRSAWKIVEDIQKLQFSLDEIDSVGNKQGMRISLGNARKQITDFVSALPKDSKMEGRDIANTLNSLSMTRLREVCRNRGIKRYSKLKKNELIREITNHIKNHGLIVHYRFLERIRVLERNHHHLEIAQLLAEPSRW
jgi:hypothetical protein